MTNPWGRQYDGAGADRADAVPLARPCIDCSIPTTRGARCPICEQGRQSRRNASRAHYHGDYAARARACRDAANADPSTLCRRCGLPALLGDPWQAGHVLDGVPDSPLAAEHTSCNAAAGGRGRSRGGG